VQIKIKFPYFHQAWKMNHLCKLKTESEHRNANMYATHSLAAQMRTVCYNALDTSISDQHTGMRLPNKNNNKIIIIANWNTTTDMIIEPTPKYRNALAARST